MNDERSPESQAEAPGAGAASGDKRPYRKPGIGWEEPWDARANLMAACGRKDGTQPGCESDLLS